MLLHLYPFSYIWKKTTKELGYGSLWLIMSTLFCSWTRTREIPRHTATSSSFTSQVACDFTFTLKYNLLSRKITESKSRKQKGSVTFYTNCICDGTYWWDTCDKNSDSFTTTVKVVTLSRLVLKELDKKFIIPLQIGNGFIGTNSRLR